MGEPGHSSTQTHVKDLQQEPESQDDGRGDGDDPHKDQGDHAVGFSSFKGINTFPLLIREKRI